jgi:hypothetical protein
VGKAKSTDEGKALGQLLDGLRKALDGASWRLQGTPSSPGLFPGGKAGAELARRALADGLLSQVPAPAGTGKGKVPAPYACVTDKGRQFVLDSVSPRRILELLGESLKSQETRLAAEVHAAAEQLAAWRGGVEQLQAGLQGQVTQYQQTARVLQSAIANATLRPHPPPAAPSLPADRVLPDDGWLDDVVRIVAEQKRHNAFDRPTLPASTSS